VDSESDSEDSVNEVGCYSAVVAVKGEKNLVPNTLKCIKFNAVNPYTSLLMHLHEHIRVPAWQNRTTNLDW